MFSSSNIDVHLLTFIYDCVQAPDMVKSSSGNLIEDVMAAPAGGPVTVYADSRDRVIPATFTPYCSMSQVSRQCRHL